MVLLRQSVNLNLFDEEQFDCENFGGLCCLSGICCKGC